jgi:hypothetical protein
MNVIMAPKKNLLLDLYINKRSSSTSRKYKVLNCKYCKWTSTNTLWALQHLEHCTTYISISELDGQLAKRQAILQLRVQSILKDKKRKLDSVATLAVYINAKPFHL